jgi:hypothetical protein
MPEAEDYDWDEIYKNLPEEFNGKKVIGVQDDFIIGGELQCCDGRVLTYSGADLERAIRWVESEHFDVTQELIAELRQAVS